MRDVAMCSIPGGPTILSSNVATGPNSAQAILASGQSPEDKDKTTLGMVIKLCIQRYYEVFDEVVDRSEIVSPSRIRTLNGESPSNADPSPSPSPAPTPGPRPILPTHLTIDGDREDEADEDIDDTMLVMPIEPGMGPGKHRSNASVQWAKGMQRPGLPAPASAATTSPVSPPSAWSDKKHRTQLSGGSSSSSPGGRSVHTSASGAGSAGMPYPTMGKAKSIVSIEGGSGTISARGGRKGSIAVGRGTTRKSVGAGVEAMGITAEGFFAPPSTSPTANGRRGGNSGAS